MRNFFLLLIVILSSCHDSVEDLGDIFPIVLGNEWTMQLGIYDNGVYIPQDTIIYRISGIKEFEINGIFYSPVGVLEEYLIYEGLEAINDVKWYCFSDNDGIYILGAETEKDTLYHKYLIYKYPTRTDDIYSYYPII